MSSDPTAPTHDLDTLRAAILRVFPELADAHFSLLPPGWHSTAVDVDGAWVFKFPRNAEAVEALQREAALLREIAPALTMQVPALSLHATALPDGNTIFSRHRKLVGEQLLPLHYAALPDEARALLAQDLALFHAELHRLDPARMAALGARPLPGWTAAEQLRAQAVPMLPLGLRDWAERRLDAIAALPPADPLGEVYGFFDGHGWNMAFDHARGRLNGVYDFADSGIGPLHREFVHASLVAPDLAFRLAAAYQSLTRRRLDRARIAALTAWHRLDEVAGAGLHHPHLIPAMIAPLHEWAMADGLDDTA